MLNKAFAALSVAALELTACAPRPAPSPDMSASTDTSYLTRLQQAGAQCASGIYNAAKGSPGTKAISSRLFESRSLVMAGNASYSSGKVVGIPYVEVPADGAEPGHAWRSCMAQEGFPG